MSRRVRLSPVDERLIRSSGRNQGSLPPSVIRRGMAEGGGTDSEVQKSGWGVVVTEFQVGVFPWPLRLYKFLDTSCLGQDKVTVVSV